MDETSVVFTHKYMAHATMTKLHILDCCHAIHKLKLYVFRKLVEGDHKKTINKSTILKFEPTTYKLNY